MAGLSKPTGVTYTGNSNTVEYQVFPESYFGGADVKIYFGDVFVDDVLGISFVLQEQVKPLYSYAARTYKEVSRGNRIVQGKFYIAFREAGYVHGILDHIGQFKDSTRNNEIVGAYNATLSSMYDGGQRLKFRARALQRFESLLSEVATEDANRNKLEGDTREQFINSQSNRYFTSYEREIWGRNLSSDKSHEGKTYFYTSRSGNFEGTNTDYQAYLKKTGFDIYITYGPIEAALTESTDGGRTLSNKQTSVSFNTTVKAIRGVQLLGSSQEIMGDNQVVEVYDFMAMDAD